MATVEQGINLHTELQQSSAGTAVSTLNFLPSVPSSWTQAHADSTYNIGAAANMWAEAANAAAHPAGDHLGQANCINLMGRMAYTSSDQHDALNDIGGLMISTSTSMELAPAGAGHNWTLVKYEDDDQNQLRHENEKTDDPQVLQYNDYVMSPSMASHKSETMLSCGAGTADREDAAAADHHHAALLIASSNPAAASSSSSRSSSSLVQQQKRHRDMSLATAAQRPAPDSPLHKKQRAALSSKDQTLSKEEPTASNGSQEVGPALNTNGRPRAKRGSATDPQSVYARQRRERINERLKILQNLVPNGAKVDIVTMLEEAISYVKFLQLQVKLLSSDEYWMYAPTTYNGIDVSFDMLQHSNQ